MNQTEELTPAQLAKLTEIAKQVVGAYPKLELLEILNRIHFITGFDYKRCIAGFKKMFRHGLIKPEFVLNIQRLPGLEAVADKAFPLIEVLGAVPVASGTFESLGTVTVLDGPTDDADEEETPRLNLSHLNADF